MDINPLVEIGNNHQLTHPKFQMEQPQSKQSHNMVNMQQVPDMGIPQPQTPMGQTQQPQHWAANIPSQSNGDDFDSNMYAILYNMNGYIAPHQDQYSYSDQQIMHSQLYHAQQPFSQQPAFLQPQSSVSQYPPLPDKIPEECLDEESATASDSLISTASSSTLPVAQPVATSPAQEATSSTIDSEMPAPRSRSKKTHNEHERVYRNKLNASLLLLGNALEGKSDNDKSKRKYFDHYHGIDD